MSASRRPAAAGRWWVGAMVLGLLLLGDQVTPVRADASAGLTLSLARRWNVAASPGTWSPYVATVHNGGYGTFTGEVDLYPVATFNSAPNGDSYPDYHAPLVVPAGGDRRTVIQVVESPGGYRAELHDGAGRVLARASPDPGTHTAAAIAVLSDLPNAAARIQTPLTTLTRVSVAFSRFTSASDFPAAAVDLSGLNGVVLDQFDSGALSGDQVQALTDFVGLGGTLIEAGGASGQRTLRALPPALVPMAPETVSTASIDPLAELGGLSSGATAQVVGGRVASWARAAVAAPGGPPLIVEGSYGAGELVELAVDPFAPPFDAQTSLAALVWSQAVSRGLSGVQGGSSTWFGPAGGPAAAGLTGSGPGAATPYPPYLTQALGQVPAVGAPPYGLLVVLLIAYVLLVSVVTGVALRLAGRMGLLWVTVPALAVAFTAAAYLFGFAGRGSHYQLVQVQVQRLAPDGAVEADSFDGVLSPRRGDLQVALPRGTLVSTAAPLYGPTVSTRAGTYVTAGPRPSVLLANVAVWDLRLVTTVSVRPGAAGQAAPGMPIDARLSLSQGRIRGQVTNHTSRTVRDLRLVSGSGASAVLAPELGPGASVAVDAPLTQTSQPVPVGKGRAPVVGLLGPPPADPGQTVMAMAAAEGASRVGQLIVVGLTDPADPLSVEGQRPARTARAALVEPVRLAAADSLASVTPTGRLVSSFSTASAGGAAELDVYELELPPGLAGHAGLVWSQVPGARQVGSVEVYDWSQQVWRPVSAAGQTLPPGDTDAQVVRVRVRESQPGATTFWVEGRP